MEFSTEEEDTGSIVVEVAESSGRRFDRLDTTIEAFSHSVADAVLEPSQNVVESAFHHLSNLNHRIETAT